MSSASTVQARMRHVLTTAACRLPPGHGAATVPPESGLLHAGVLGCALKRPTRSDLAVDGGVPFASAGASAHHPSVVPSRRRTATRPYAGSSRVYAQPAFPPLA